MEKYIQDSLFLNNTEGMSDIATTIRNQLYLTEGGGSFI